MRVLTFTSAEAVAEAATDELAAAAAARPELVLGLATGRTMLPLYEALARRHAAATIDLSRTSAWNLDELCLPRGHRHSFRAYMESHVWGRTGIARDRSRLPDSAAADPELESARYEAALAVAGGLDLALVGVGADGHIAYNLPGPARREAHVVELPDAVADTLGIATADRPLRAITLGLDAILGARRLLLLATTADKAAAVRALLEGPETPEWPCSLLRPHPRLDVLLTPAARGDDAGPRGRGW